MKKKILLVQLAIDNPGPRNIRSANIMKHLSRIYEIDIITFNSIDEKITIPGVNFLRLELSWISKFFTQRSLSGFEPFPLIKLICRIISGLIGKLVLVDVWELEHRNVLRYLVKNQLIDSYDFIISSIVPFSAGTLGYKIQQISKKNPPLVLDIGDPLFGNSVPSFFIRKWRYFKIEQSIVNYADKIIVTNDDTMNYYSSNFNFEITKLAVIPQGVDLKLFSNNKSIFSSTNKETKLRIIYAGAFYKGLRDPEEFFNAISQLDIIDYVDVYCSEKLKYLSSDYRVSFKNKLGQYDLVKEYNKSNVLLYIDNFYGLQTSGKIFELLSLRKLILFIYENDNSAVKKSVINFPNIIFVKNDNKLIINALKKIYFSKAMKFDYNIDQFSWETRAKAFTTFLEK